MAWVGTNSTNVSISQGGAADLLWAIKSALLEAGWRLMSYGGGAGSGTYQAPNGDGATAVADGLTTAASLNVNGAWFRMKEPGSTTAGRELVFQRGDAVKELIIKYSKETGFTGSNATYAVGEQYSPTTGGGDGVVVSSSSYTTSDDTTVRSLYGMESCPSSGYVQVVASNAADGNGVWPFYAWSYTSPTSRTGSYLFSLDGLLVGSHHPLDSDPCCFSVFPLSPSMSSGWVAYWHGYGLSGASWLRGAAANGSGMCYPGGTKQQASSFKQFGAHNLSDAGAAESLTDYKTQISLLPVGYSSGANTVGTWKGFSPNVVTFGASVSPNHVFNSGSNNPRVSILNSYSAAGWMPCGIAVPWVPNKVPAG